MLTVCVSAPVCRYPATIFGHVFNGPATLIDTVASTTGGCDTARTITITTAPLLTTTVSATVCANDFPATIFGHVFNGPGTLIDTVASTTGGCDTARTINVTTAPLLTTTVSATVCANDFPATIFGHVFNGPGTLIDTVASTTGGCDTARTINITTAPLLTTTVSATVCRYPATIFGHVFNGPATLIDTVASTTGGCDTARTITITTAPLLTTTVSATVCANDFPATIFGHVFNGPGTLIDTVASTTGGCDTARTITITTAPLLTTTVSATVCANDFPATIFGHVFNGPGTLIDKVARVGGGCDTARTITVTTAPLLTTTVSATVCANDFPATIFGHVFNGPATLIDTVASTTGGCDTARTITVTTAPLLTTTVSATVCANDFPATIFGHVFNGPGTL